MRTPHGQFPEYHTSADNLSFIKTDKLADSFQKYVSVVEVLEENRRYINSNPKCEPQLGKRGIYSTIGGRNDTESMQMALLWVLNLSDNNNDLLDIAERSGMPFGLIAEAAKILQRNGLLETAKE
jgi:aminopeptidase-like protein